MSIAVLPFNAGPNTKPALARQFANFAVEIVRAHTGADVNSVNYLVRVEEQPVERFANVNPSEKLNEEQIIEQLLTQTQTEKAMDGLLVQTDSGFELEYRTYQGGNSKPAGGDKLTFLQPGLFGALRQVVEALAELAGTQLPAEMSDDEKLFGTANPEAFLKFLEGYDALQYVAKTQGRVAREFVPLGGYESLVRAVELDPDWEGPYATLVQLTRECTRHRIGRSEDIVNVLNKLMVLNAEDGRPHYALGELHQALGNNPAALEQFEKAAAKMPDESAVLIRLGAMELQMGMPVNAEKNLRKANEMEGGVGPALDHLAQALTASQRLHEVPPLWKEALEKQPDNPQFHAKYAIALANAGDEEASVAAFEKGLATVEPDALPLIKRYYAQLLAKRQDYDRAMDFYEDCIEVSPQDIPVKLEYAQVLKAAGREFEVPHVLDQVLALNPDPNTSAQARAWKVEINEPKRVEAVMQAQEKLNEGDPEAALKLLRPLKNWLADYWKMWMVLAAAQNKAGEPREAEEAAKNLLNLFPGCEPAYGELAMALGAQGKQEEAYQMMRVGMQHVPGSLPVAINLALAAQRTGRKDEAENLADQIRKVAGENEQVKLALAEIG